MDKSDLRLSPISEAIQRREWVPVPASRNLPNDLSVVFWFRSMHPNNLSSDPYTILEFLDPDIPSFFLGATLSLDASVSKFCFGKSLLFLRTLSRSGIRRRALFVEKVIKLIVAIISRSDLEIACFMQLFGQKVKKIMAGQNVQTVYGFDVLPFFTDCGRTSQRWKRLYLASPGTAWHIPVHHQ